MIAAIPNIIGWLAISFAKVSYKFLAISRVDSMPI
jgi:hypothetical protein